MVVRRRGRVVMVPRGEGVVRIVVGVKTHLHHLSSLLPQLIQQILVVVARVIALPCAARLRSCTMRMRIVRARMRICDGTCEWGSSTRGGWRRGERIICVVFCGVVEIGITCVGICGMIEIIAADVVTCIVAVVIVVEVVIKSRTWTSIPIS